MGQRAGQQVPERGGSPRPAAPSVPGVRHAGPEDPGVRGTRGNGAEMSSWSSTLCCGDINSYGFCVQNVILISSL